LASPGLGNQLLSCGFTPFLTCGRVRAKSGIFFFFNPFFLSPAPLGRYVFPGFRFHPLGSPLEMGFCLQRLKLSLSDLGGQFVCIATPTSLKVPCSTPSPLVLAQSSFRKQFFPKTGFFAVTFVPCKNIAGRVAFFFYPK